MSKPLKKGYRFSGLKTFRLEKVDVKKKKGTDRLQSNSRPAPASTTNEIGGLEKTPAWPGTKE
jgi:hypothetical protein